MLLGFYALKNTLLKTDKIKNNYFLALKMNTLHVYFTVSYSRAQVAQRAAKRSPTLIWQRKGNP